MPWVRFWSKSNCPSGIKAQEESFYEWFDRCPPEGFLQQLAGEFAEKAPWGQSERGYKYGFEKLKRLPAKVRKALLEEARDEFERIDKRITLLGG